MYLCCSRGEVLYCLCYDCVVCTCVVVVALVLYCLCYDCVCQFKGLQEGQSCNMTQQQQQQQQPGPSPDASAAAAASILLTPTALLTHKGEDIRDKCYIFD